MSDGNNGDITKPKKEATSPVDTTTAPDTAAPRRSRLGLLSSDLQSALETWDIVSEQVANKVSPEQEQLREVKKILSDLKSKLEQFEND